MKKLILTTLLLTGIFTSMVAQRIEPNYDESKVPVYELPPLLVSAKGKQIKSIKQWESIRRPEILEMFSSQMFGKTPGSPFTTSYEVVSVDANALDGKATCKQLRISFSNGNTVRSMLMLIYLPNHIKGKVPLFFAYNFDGNQTVSTDPGILFSNHTLENKRGLKVRRWPIEMIISKGYGVATACYHDIFYDEKDKHAESILPLLGYYPGQPLEGDSWQAIGAWAWGMSRAMDYFETDSRIDAKRIALMGHSRHGKAALWAGAQDQRFAIVISNESGCGGAALSKRAYGETVAVITNSFPHWFCPNFSRFANNEQSLPFDQHELIALIAPRPVYVASAVDDRWADPKGEYLSAFHAGEVYRLYGYEGLPSEEMPALNTPVISRVGYHIRTGVHDVTDFDWQCYLNFADKWMK